MRRVILESPYAGEVEANVAYARKCLLDSINHGEAPLASHLLYTQALNDTDPHERSIGIAAGLTWMEVADLVVFYVDRGWSHGMLAALKRTRVLGKPYQVRSIYGAVDIYEAPQ